MQSIEISIAIITSIQQNSAITGQGYVSLTAVREDVSRYQRGDIDAALIKMIEEGTIIAIPESNQKTLRPQDRKAALRCGGQDKHLICLG